jgi:hypothetical protein
MQVLRSVHQKLTTLTNSILNRAHFVIKIAILFICLGTVFSGHYPPVHAQSRRIQTVPVITTEDAMQDDRITAINRHLEATDAHLEALRLVADETKNGQTFIQGEIAAVGLLLTVLTIAALIVQLKTKQV